MGQDMKKIKPESLVSMDIFEKEGGLRIELAYARSDNLLLGEAVYRPDARLWLHKDLAEIVVAAAKTVKQQGLLMVVYDGLRTVEAQQKMLETARVKANPQWLREPRLLSSPGMGGHPRGMAVDVALERNGKLLDMGTAFDYLAEKSDPANNPAHRQHPKLSDEARSNRQILDEAMIGAAKALNRPLLALPQEWWDFRLPKEIYEAYAPLSDPDLPPEMRMTLNSGVDPLVPRLQ